MSKIISIKAREVLNSKNDKTVEVVLETTKGKFTSSIPSGVSKGSYEAVEIDVKQAIKNIEEIIFPELKGKDSREQKKIDKIMIELDGTKDKSKLGANAILPISLSLARSAAFAEGVPLWKWISELSSLKYSLPKPCMLFVEGGLHGFGKLNTQEFMLVLKERSLKESLNTGIEIYTHLNNSLNEKYGALETGLEGGLIPPLDETEQVLDLIMESKKGNTSFFLDMAASEFFENNQYNFEEQSFSKKEMVHYYLNLKKKYPIELIEDPFSLQDLESWKMLHNNNVYVVGDDLLATNTNRMKEYSSLCNAMILKPNQVGTVTESIEAAILAKQLSWKVIVSHRGGETCDSFIADFAVGVGSDFAKLGGPFQKQRKIKYDRLLAIEQELC